MTFAGAIPICRELSVASGSVDLVYVNENEFAPAMEASVFDVDENPSNEKALGVIEATDKDSHQSLTYSIKTLEANE